MYSHDESTYSIQIAFNLLYSTSKEQKDGSLEKIKTTFAMTQDNSVQKYI